MKTELIYVTPKQARAWLKHNTDNRRLRPGVVEGLKAAYERGEWKLTHQGIAFASTGRLIDGQHRLTFISQLDGEEGVPIMVTTGAHEDTFDVIDQGARRTVSDVMGVSQGLAAVGMFFARLNLQGRTGGITASYVSPFVDWVQPEFERLITFSPSAAKIWSSAAIRAAAVYQIKRGHDEDQIKVAYRSLVLADIDSMPPAARALMQQYMIGKIMSARGLDLFCRASRVFDTKTKNGSSRIIVRDQPAQIADLRAFIASQMKKGPTSAGPMVAKPGHNSRAMRVA